MDFQNIVGNEKLRALLSSHIRNKTLSHSYIIEGPEGSGKRTLAKEICKALCCEDRGGSIPCGGCRSCRRIEEGYNTDIYTLNRGEKASISVDDVRMMTDTLGYYPDDGDVKIYVIEEAEKMTVQAQNALLLSLEEPPKYVVFLLLTTDSTALLETVRSRAQCLKTQLFPTTLVYQWLSERPECKKAEKDELLTCATASRGSLGAALLSYSRKSSRSKSIADDAMRLIELLCTQSRTDAIIFASGLKYSRVEFEQFFDFAIFAVRDLLSSKYKDIPTTCYADPEAAGALGARLKVSRLVKIYDALVGAKEDITKNNAHIYAVMTTLAAGAF